MTVVASAAWQEQTRARYPDEAGWVQRDRLRIAWERYGSHRRAILLMPAWEIVHSRAWKFQIAFLARSFSVLTFDPRGNGRSDRPRAVAAYNRAERSLDAIAVLDAAAIDRATVVSWCAPGDDLRLAGAHPDRIDGLVMIAPDLRLTPTPNEDIYQRISRWPAFPDEFFGLVFPEPHSTKQHEDAVGWALATSPEVLRRSLQASWGNSAAQARELLRRITCPVLLIQGSLDQIAGPDRGRAVAHELDRPRLVGFEGSGHAPHLRDPVAFNRGLADFLAAPRAGRSGWTRAMSRPRRALYVSSPIGLGHVRRDLAIADELRRFHPDLEIDWLAQHPVTALLEERAERVHPLSAELASESAHFRAESAGHDLHAFQALRRMDEILLANFMVFLDAVQQEAYDLWIGDEAWDIDYYLHENPELKTAAYAWLTDFVGYLPMKDADERERFVAADLNEEMIEHIARFPRVRDRAIFVGDPEDIVADQFGPGLPFIRDWTEQHFSFSGQIAGFDPAQLTDRRALRSALGYAPDERVCLVTVGGSGVGCALLERVIASFPEARRLVPQLRMVAVAGPRIDPGTLGVSQHDGLEISAYVPHLYRHLAACDVAIVQGGLTTTMELTANRRPFIYIPLGHHFEQQFHVHHRLQRHRAGRRMDFDELSPQALATAIAEEVGREVDYHPVSNDGAVRAAALIADLL